jgi:hypothetical protein
LIFTGAIASEKFTAIDISSDRPNYLLAGNSQGQLYLSEDRGKNWRLQGTIAKNSVISTIALTEF